MYDPKGNAKDKTVNSVQFAEAEPPSHLRDIVHRFLELKTDGALTANYRFHALPDACVYIIFDQSNAQIAGITQLRAASEELDLGNSFHYVNIRFLPGVWQGGRDQFSYGMVANSYEGDLSLTKINCELADNNFDTQQSILSKFVDNLVERKLVVANPVTHKIFQNLDEIHTVSDMAGIAGLSPRQLQRTLKRTTGFAPHDFLKVLRLQQALGGDHQTHYADQSHFIHSFRKATGYTPAKYTKKFDV